MWKLSGTCAVLLILVICGGCISSNHAINSNQTLYTETTNKSCPNLLEGFSCCNGVSYMPAFNSCCNGQLFRLDSQSCCNGKIGSVEMLETR